MYPKKLTYNVSSDKKLGKSNTYVKNFIKTVELILSDPRTWPVKFIKLEDKVDIDFKIILTSPKFIKHECGFSGLSCASLLDNTIYINSNRWSKGSKKFKGSIRLYRQYLINHEVGHILGKVHPEKSEIDAKKKCKAPVMSQQTLGTGDCEPTGWPLESEI